MGEKRGEVRIDRVFRDGEGIEEDIYEIESDGVDGLLFIKLFRRSRFFSCVRINELGLRCGVGLRGF